MQLYLTLPATEGHLVIFSFNQPSSSVNCSMDRTQIHKPPLIKYQQWTLLLLFFLTNEQENRKKGDLQHNRYKIHIHPHLTPEMGYSLPLSALMQPKLHSWDYNKATCRTTKQTLSWWSQYVALIKRRVQSVLQHDIMVKLTFDCLDIKHHALSFQTFEIKIYVIIIQGIV